MSGGLPAVLARLAPVVSLAPLSRRGASPAFRLEPAVGPDLKARVFASAALARRVERLLRVAPALPRPLFRQGAVLVTEFVVGAGVDRLLAASPHAAPDLAAAAGALLARLHACRGSGRAAPVAFHASRLRRVLSRLVRLRLLDEADRRRLAALRVPSRAPVVLTHGDLCPENLVLTPGRRLRAIDEERLAMRPLGFELARTVARWPLDAALEARLLEGYGRAGGSPASYVAARAFWLGVVLATSIDYRLRVAPGTLGPALDALRRLARELSEGRARP